MYELCLPRFSQWSIHLSKMVKKKRVRLIAEMARKIRAYRELKSQPRESEKYALDYKTMKRPHTGKTLPVLAWEDVGRESRLFTLLSGLSLFGVGRIFTRKSWLADHPEPSYWQITKVKVDYVAEVRGGGLQNVRSFLVAHQYNQSANYTMTIGGVNFFSRACQICCFCLFWGVQVVVGSNSPNPPVIRTLSITLSSDNMRDIASK